MKSKKETRIVREIKVKGYLKKLNALYEEDFKKAETPQ